MKTLKHLFVYGFFLCLSSFLFAQTSVWKVSSGTDVIYLGGSCHLLRPSDFPLPSAFEEAYAAADHLVFEIDPSALKSPAFSMQLLAASRYQDGRTLKDVLSQRAYSALSKQAEASGIPMVILESMKPGMVVTMLSMQELVRIGVTEEGVDLHFAKKANQDRKSIGSLETVAFQIELLTSMGEGMESELVLYTLKDLEQVERLYDQLIRAWRSGHLDAIQELFVDDMMGYPQLYEEMLQSRNEAWVPQIEAMFGNRETEFVLVGVGHIPGPDGLIHLLQDAGYQVEQL